MKLKTIAYRGRLPSCRRLVTLYSFFFEGFKLPITGSDPKLNNFTISKLPTCFEISSFEMKTSLLFLLKNHCFPPAPLITSSVIKTNRLSYQIIGLLIKLGMHLKWIYVQVHEVSKNYNTSTLHILIINKFKI